MKLAGLLLLLLLGLDAAAQKLDTTIVWDKKTITLPEVIVRNDFDYRKILSIIKEDTTFYKAFKNLRMVEYTSLNHIYIYDKKGTVKASNESKTRQHRSGGCRSMTVLAEKTTGDFYNKKREYNYMTAGLYAGIFFTKGKICGENNIVKGTQFNTSDKKGLDKHKEQLKMLFFNPGKRIPGIPFIGNKLDLYDDDARKVYDYRLDYTEYKGIPAYIFSIKPKENLGLFRRDDVVVDEMTTWFDSRTMEVLARNYYLSYKAGVYDFDVQIEVEMKRVNGMLLPDVLRYKGTWDVVFKKRERASFTATIFDVVSGH